MAKRHCQGLPVRPRTSFFSSLSLSFLTQRREEANTYFWVLRGKKVEEWMPKDLEDIGLRAVFKATDRL